MERQRISFFSEKDDERSVGETKSERVEIMENTELIEQVIKKPTKGRGGKNNFPASKFTPQTNEDKALVGKLLTEVLVEYKQPKVKSDEELAERIDNYFHRCAENGQVPTVEEMCMCTGYSYSTIWDWENGRRHGFSNSTADIIKKAKDVLKTFDAKLVISGKLNFLAYCFRAKNYYGMVDKQEYVVTPNTQNDSDYSPDDIRKKYLTGETTIDSEATIDSNE
jgi:transcriptional regulator with XRE-family HTH domain